MASRLAESGDGTLYGKTMIHELDGPAAGLVGQTLTSAGTRRSLLASPAFSKLPTGSPLPR
ncbi:MAG: hypothetical protein HOO96_08700 [Polyangiaceae bacterium]|nr:hypothetical protein [Polyangiaceae bacterium]